MSQEQFPSRPLSGESTGEAAADRASLWRSWHDAAQQTQLDQEIRTLYADLDAQVKANPQAVCNASGRCCKFNTYDHLLYVTGLEIAWFLLNHANPPETQAAKRASNTTESVVLPVLPTAQSPLPKARDSLPDACRYQIDGLCSTHAIRPLGCRVFFCQSTTEAWQHDTYEHFLKRLTDLHEAHGVAYRYMEWRAGLIEADGHLGV